MPKAKKPADKIVIRGRSYDQEYFAPQPIDEFTLKELIPHISDIGEIAREGSKDLDGLVGNSPLSYIEGLLRYQLKQIDDESSQYFSELKDLDSFDIYFELIHDLPTKTPDTKIVFLFDFLRDIVILSCFPHLITDTYLEKITVNLRALSFLVEPQLNGRIKPGEHIFEHFAYNVWLFAGGKKISGQQFFDAAKRLIKKKDGEVVFWYRRWGWEPNLKYIATIDCSERIKLECETRGVNIGRPKSLGQINNIWAGLQKKFIARSEKNSAQA